MEKVLVALCCIALLLWDPRGTTDPHPPPKLPPQQTSSHDFNLFLTLFLTAIAGNSDPHFR